MSEWTINTLKAHITQIIEINDRLYIQKFESAEKAVDAAFLASEKAIIKAEDAQREYNIRSNEFRGQLDDQAKLLISRSEVMSLFRAVDDKIVVMQKTSDQKFDDVRMLIEKIAASSASEIAGLRESRSQLSGNKSGIQDMMGWFLAAVAIGGFILDKIIFP